jgi:hypothetical protein
MEPVKSRAAAGRVLLHHTSAHGPTVTHVRGILLANAQQNMKDFGMYQHYLELLPPTARGHLEGLIAASWIDIELALIHYMTVEQVAIQRNVDQSSAVEQVAARLADRISRTFLASAAKAARDAGIEAFLFVMKNNNRVWDRIYMGGSTAVLHCGPKEIIIEDHGLPLLSCAAFRLGYHAYLKAMASLLCKAAFIRPARAQQPHPHTIATRVSWV